MVNKKEKIVADRVPTPASDQMAKDARIAAVLSLIFPGAGQIYIGRLDRGIVIAILNIILLVLAGMTGICCLAWLPFWVYAVYDAYNLAMKK